MFVGRYWECLREEGGRCIKYRETVYVKGPIDVEAYFGIKYKQCIPVFEKKVKVGEVCIEGQVILNGRILDGKYADLIKAAVEQLQEGWHSLDEPAVKTLLDISQKILKSL